jgi:hypothetical protein
MLISPSSIFTMSRARSSVVSRLNCISRKLATLRKKYRRNGVT